MMHFRRTAVLLVYALTGSVAHATEPNETFATRSLLPSGVLLVTDSLTAPNPYPDTYLGILTLAGDPGPADDDSSRYGNGFASGLQSISVEADSIRFEVTGYGDLSFVGAHTEMGQFEVFVDVHDSSGQPIDSFSELRTLEAGGIQQFLYSDPSWSGSLFDVNIENRRPPNDIDFFTFSDLIPGAYFAARTVNPHIPTLDTFLGWFDDTGSLIKSNDDYGQGALSRILGVVPSNGKLTFAVTGFGDFGFEGLHSQEGTYDLEIIQTVNPVPGDYNGDFEVNAADYTVWRNHAQQSFVLNGENPNAVTKGFVDQEDYQFWKLHYGESLGGGASTVIPTAVPESSGAALCFLAIGYLCGNRRLNHGRSRKGNGIPRGDRAPALHSLHRGLAANGRIHA